MERVAAWTRADGANQARSAVRLRHPARLLVVIVNYRTADLAIDCLRSLAPEIRTITGASVVVTDNDSGDGSVGRIRKAIEDHGWEDWLSLVPLDCNRGFAYGNNAVIRPVLESSGPLLPEYVLLLNPDTLVRPGAVAALLEFMDSNPKAGIAGSRLENPDGSPQYSCHRFHTFWSELESGLRLGVISKLLGKRVVSPFPVNKTHSTDWVCGASMIIRRGVFEDIGLLDPAYFLYFEEVDFCLQAAKAGWECWYVPQSRVVHLEGQSTGVMDTQPTQIRRPRYWFESRRRYFEKNHGFVYAILADVVWAASFAAWRVRRVLQGKPDTDPPHMLRDFLRFSLHHGPLKS